MNWSDLSPSWPHDFDLWQLFVFLVLTAFSRLDRGRILYKNSDYIDRLGASIIVWDFLLGAYAASILIWILYPGLHHLWWQRAILALAGLIAIWQWYEVRKADRERVARAMGSASVPIETPDYTGPERRIGPPDRRRTTAEVYHRDRGDY